MKALVLVLALLAACNPAADKAAAEAEARAAKAEAERDQAQKDLQAVTDQVDRLKRDLEDLDAKVQKAVDALVAAQTDADRANARSKLEQLQRDKADMEKRLDATGAAAAKAQRTRSMKIEKRCLDNPLAAGCS